VITTTVFLARHGQSRWNRRKLVTGQLDPELAPEGQTQARDLALLLRDMPLSAVYASDLSRSRETARAVAEDHGLAVQVVPALRELHFGALQGRFRDARDPEAAALWRARKADPVGFRAPGGETFAELSTRVRPALRHILAAHPAGSVLIVGHRNTNRAILATLLDRTPEIAVTTAIPQDCLYRVQLGGVPAFSVLRFSARSAPVVTVPL
jgi:broad specificity phosphatase PhoE